MKSFRTTRQGEVAEDRASLDLVKNPGGISPNRALAKVQLSYGGQLQLEMQGHNEIRDRGS